MAAPNPFEQYMTIQGPEPTQAADDNPFRRYAATPSPALVPASTMAGDVAKSAGIGLAQGVIGLATLPGNIEQLGRAGVNWGAEKLGIQPPLNPDSALTNYGDLKKRVEGYTGAFYEPKTTAGKYARTIGEFAPGLVGGGAPGLLNKASRVAVPAVASEAAGQAFEGTAAEPWARAAGALAGGVLTTPTQRVGHAPAPVDPTRAAHVANLEAEGVNAMTAGQYTGNKGLRWLEDSTATVVGSGNGPRTAANMQTQAAEQFTAAALRRAGINETRATPEAMNNAFQAIGQEYQALGQVADVPTTPRFGARVEAIATEYNDLTPPSVRVPLVKRIANDLTTAAQTAVAIPGPAYNAWRSQLRAAQRSQASNPEASRTIGRMVEALDAQMIRGFPAAQRPEMLAYTRDLNTRYRNMLAIEKAAGAAGENAALGLLSPAALKNAVKAQNARDYTRGRSELGNLARSGEAVLKPLRSSGTAERTMAQQMLSTPGMFLGGVAGGDPLSMLAGTVAPAVAKALTARMVMSRPVQALARQRMGVHVPGRQSAYTARVLPQIGAKGLLALGGGS